MLSTHAGTAFTEFPCLFIHSDMQLLIPRRNVRNSPLRTQILIVIGIGMAQGKGRSGAPKTCVRLSSHCLSGSWIGKSVADAVPCPDESLVSRVLGFQTIATRSGRSYWEQFCAQNRASAIHSSCSVIYVFLHVQWSGNCIRKLICSVNERRWYHMPIRRQGMY